MKLSVIISTYNRLKLFSYVLMSLSKQNFPRSEMEIVVVDDSSTEDTLGLLKHYKSIIGCQIQYIRIDGSRYDFSLKYHTPALTNNIGFRNAQGDIYLIQGNDVMHLYRDNLWIGYKLSLLGLSVFGEIWECNQNFIKFLDTDKEWLELNELMPLYDKEGAKHNSVHMTNWYWYVMFVKREFVHKINGVDEEYLKGVYAEDNDFERRIVMAGSKHHREMQIKALHLWHYDEGLDNPKQWRWGSGTWEQAAEINRTRWRNFCNNPQMIANLDRYWGDQKVVVEKVIL